ncbi:MAG: S8 family serine peptidase [Alphaproteobacteria bacterium]|nr:S8 family serine peptidase [Alphaproteobacteria bacterium]
MRPSSWIHRITVAGLAPFVAAAGTGLAAANPAPADLMRDVLEAMCVAPEAGLEAVATAIQDAVPSTAGSVIPSPHAFGRESVALDIDRGGRIVVDRRLVRGQVRRFTITYDEPVSDGKMRPVLQVAASADCTNVDGRRLVYDDSDRPARLEHLDPGLQAVLYDEPLNPPPPPGPDPDGVTVALIDSGVNYTLPFVADRLARDTAGRILGYDYWDDDDRPYDIDGRGGAFFPLHHGTAVASVLLREGPDVRLLPFRYPRPRMDRMADLIAAADRAGALIVTVPMSSTNPEEWSAFVDAAGSRPHMLFIMAAGNEGQDLARSPRYPAAAGLDNALVVTSSTPFGKLAPGSNWGVDRVDFMVPAEQVEAIDHRGARRKASGSSFAVPRVAALAARLLAENPSWRAPELKAAILARANRSPYQRPAVTRFGWIANPADDE